MTPLRNRPPLLRLGILALIFPGTLLAWSEHAVGTYPALRAMPELKSAAPVRVEPLEDFLRAEAEGLAKLLDQEEAWARANLHPYAPRPDSLRFDPDGDPATIRERFLHAIRVNPTIPLKNFVQLPPGQTMAERPALDFRAVSIFQDPYWLAHIDFRRLTPGATLDPVHVLSTASDEPDLGHDVYVYENNGKPFGQLYRFGEQPFGNQAFEYSTQAPFHMGFFHESAIIFAAAGYLKRTHSLDRIHLYRTLARFAFETGHPYWGYRFTGWGLHYVGDLTMPYHSRVLPGVGTLRMLWISIKDIFGFHQARRDAVNIVANRHTSLERYQRSLMARALKEQPDHPVLRAAGDIHYDAQFGQWNDATARDVVAADAVARADQVDALLEKWMPKDYVDNPDYKWPRDTEEVYREVSANYPQAADPMAHMLEELFREFGAHTRNYVRSCLEGDL